jgi:hypothetical protein
LFGLIETELTPRPVGWERIRSALGRADGVSVTEERVWGAVLARTRVRFRCGDGPERNRRRVAAALAFLRGMGVRGVVTPAGFAYGDLLPAYGLAASTPVPLYRRLAARLAVHAADRLGVGADRLRVCVVAKRATPEVAAAAEALCPRARFLSLLLDRPDVTGLCRALRRRHGVSVMENPAGAALADTDVYLVFDAWPVPLSLPAKPGAVVLALAGGEFDLPPGCLVADGARLAPPRRLRDGWPWEADPEALLAALYAAGAVRLDEIKLERLPLQRTGGSGQSGFLSAAGLTRNFNLTNRGEIHILTGNVISPERLSFPEKLTIV